jgi:hypothetical protein
MLRGYSCFKIKRISGVRSLAAEMRATESVELAEFGDWW